MLRGCVFPVQVLRRQLRRLLLLHQARVWLFCAPGRACHAVSVAAAPIRFPFSFGDLGAVFFQNKKELLRVHPAAEEDRLDARRLSSGGTFGDASQEVLTTHPANMHVAHMRATGLKGCIDLYENTPTDVESVVQVLAKKFHDGIPVTLVVCVWMRGHVR